MPTFGERFKSLRLEKNMKQEELINDFNKKFHYNFTKSAVSQYENDKRIPEIQALNDFSNYFGVSVDYLLENDNNCDPAYKPTDEDIKFALFDGADNITDEMYEEVKRFAEYVKQRENK